MILISHRGNTDGKDPTSENKPDYILDAINKGFHCEIDVWFNDGNLFLGHDNKDTKIDISFLKNEKLWCHAKNLKALELMLKNNIHCFWHEDDLVTLTSRGWTWCHPKCKDGGEKSIIVKPEINKIDYNNFTGICSDYVTKYISL